MTKRQGSCTELVNGLTPSRQCYLAEILSLEGEQGRVRQSEIAARMGVNRPSVTAALRTLAERSFIRYEPYGDVVLTAEGRQTAQNILARRRIITEYLLTFLDITDGVAHEAACRMQYAVPDIIVDQFSKQVRRRENDLPTGGNPY